MSTLFTLLGLLSFFSFSIGFAPPVSQCVDCRRQCVQHTPWVIARTRTRPIAAAVEEANVDEEDEFDEDDEENYRLTSASEAVTAAALAAGMAGIAGTEILDAGVIGSSLIVGAAIGWLAENDDGGLGDIARGLGRVGSTVRSGVQETGVVDKLGAAAGEGASVVAKKAGNIAERTKQKLAEADMQVELAKLNPVEMVEADKDLE
jgi:hypothetical protein